MDIHVNTTFDLDEEVYYINHDGVTVSATRTPVKEIHILHANKSTTVKYKLAGFDELIDGSKLSSDSDEANYKIRELLLKKGV